MSDIHVHGPNELPAELPRFNVSTTAMAASAVVGVVALALTFVLGGGERGMASYLVGVCYWFTICLGALFMLMTFHASAARWAMGFRRIIEILSLGVMTFLLWLIPVFMNVNAGAKSIYSWARPGFEFGEEGDVLGFRMWWLNPGHFVARGVVYLVGFALAAWFAYSWSRQQDTSNDAALSTKLIRLGSGGAPILALLGTAASFDWIMSVNPHWGSTIFGAYVMGGGYLAALALTALLAHGMRVGTLRGIVGQFEFHNLGKLLFALVCFWAYLGYAQYMLMWIANLPEEIHWWLERKNGMWNLFFWILIFGHFVAPFFFLIRKDAKLFSGWVRFVAVWILVMHFVDISWLILPSLKNAAGEQLTLGITDILAVLGVGGIQVAFLLWRFRGVVAAPKGDPNFAAPVVAH